MKPNGYFVREETKCSECNRICYVGGRDKKEVGYYVWNEKKLCRNCAKMNRVI